MSNLKNIFIILIAVGLSSFASFLLQPDNTEKVKSELSGAFVMIDGNFSDMSQHITEVEVEGNKKNEQQDLYMSGMNKRLKDLGKKVYSENGDIYARLNQLEGENAKLKSQIVDF